VFLFNKLVQVEGLVTGWAIASGNGFRRRKMGFNQGPLLAGDAHDMLHESIQRRIFLSKK
ncbi:hypothetical protein ACFLUA_03080, partial [Chloroflexota bacterium]